MEYVILHAPKVPIWTERWLKTLPDLLIERLFVIDPHWEGTCAVQHPPKGLKGVFKVTKLSKRRKSAYFNYSDDEGKGREYVVPFTATRFLPLEGEIPTESEQFNNLLVGWADLWEKYTEAAEEAGKAQEYKQELDEAVREYRKLLTQVEALYMAAGCAIMEKDKKINELAGRVLDSEQELLDLAIDEEMGPIQTKIQAIFWGWVAPGAVYTFSAFLFAVVLKSLLN